jgi:hypothetical protein
MATVRNSEISVVDTEVQVQLVQLKEIAIIADQFF